MLKAVYQVVCILCSVHCTLTIFSSFGRRFFFSYTKGNCTCIYCMYTAFAINHTSLMFWQYTMYNVMYNTMYNIHSKWGVQDRMSSSPLLKQCDLFSTYILRWARMSVPGTVSWFQHHQLYLYHHLLKTSSKPLDLVVVWISAILVAMDEA